MADTLYLPDGSARVIPFPKEFPREMQQEIGTTGTTVWAGVIQEEYNADLDGDKGLETYDKMRKSDAQIAATLLVIELPVRSAQWYILAPSDDELDRKVATFLHQSLFEDMTVTFDDFMREALTCLTFGFAVCEKIFETHEDGLVHWSKFASRKQTTRNKWLFDSNGGPAGMEQLAPPSYKTVSIPIEKLLIFSHRKEGSNLDGISMLRAAYKHWWYKEQLYRIQGIGMERELVGLPYITLPESASDSDRVQALKIVKELRRDEKAGLVIKKPWEIHTLSGGSSGANIEGAINHHNRMIPLSVLAQFLDLGGGDRGSWALSRDQSALLFYSLNALANWFRDTINRYAIKQLIEFNFPEYRNNKRPMPKLEHGQVGERDWNQLITAVNTLLTTGIINPQGGELEQYFRSEMGLPDKPQIIKPKYAPNYPIRVGAVLEPENVLAPEEPPVPEAVPVPEEEELATPDNVLLHEVILLEQDIAEFAKLPAERQAYLQSKYEIREGKIYNKQTGEQMKGAIFDTIAKALGLDPDVLRAQANAAKAAKAGPGAIKKIQDTAAKVEAEQMKLELTKEASSLHSIDWDDFNTKAEQMGWTGTDDGFTDRASALLGAKQAALRWPERTFAVVKVGKEWTLAFKKQEKGDGDTTEEGQLPAQPKGVLGTIPGIAEIDRKLREIEQQKKAASREAEQNRKDAEQETKRLEKDAEREAKRQTRDAARQARSDQREAERAVKESTAEARITQREAERAKREAERAANTETEQKARDAERKAREMEKQAAEATRRAEAIAKETKRKATQLYVQEAKLQISGLQNIPLADLPDRLAAKGWAMEPRQYFDPEQKTLAQQTAKLLGLKDPGYLYSLVSTDSDIVIIKKPSMTPGSRKAQEMEEYIELLTETDALLEELEQLAEESYEIELFAEPGQMLEQLLAESGNRLDIRTELMKTGKLRPSWWYRDVVSELYKTNRQAYLLGVRSLDPMAKLSVKDLEIIKSEVTRQTDYLSNFLEDVRAQRDARAEMGARINQRARMYAQSAKNMFFDAQATKNKELRPKQTLIVWHTTPREHCKTCLGRDGRAYTYADLPGYPGDGSTPCLGSCGCYLTYEETK